MMIESAFLPLTKVSGMQTQEINGFQHGLLKDINENFFSRAGQVNALSH